MELPKRKRNRLAEYDYCTPNAYFITICTDGRKCFFWKNTEARILCRQDVQLSQYGIVVDACIKKIPQNYPAISVDKYVIMPNHIHLLLQIQSTDDGLPMVAPGISTVVQQLKRAVTKQIGISIWQKSYYDHIVRSEVDYQDIWNYIDGNPLKWEEDQLRSNHQ